MKLSSLIAVAALAPACSSTAPVPLAWQGAASHLVVTGRVDGSNVAIDMRSDDPDVLACHREYEAPVVGNETVWSEGHLVTVSVDASIGDQILRLTFAPNAAPLGLQGTTWFLVPPDHQRLSSGQAQLEWAWLELPIRDETYDAIAEAGTVEVELFDGTPDDSGLVVPAGVGSFGALVSAHWNTTDSVVISLSARCFDNRIDRILETP